MRISLVHTCVSAVEGQFFVREVPDEKLQLQYASLASSVIAFEGFDLFRIFSVCTSLQYLCA
jgi:hypothetical protein